MEAVETSVAKRPKDVEAADMTEELQQNAAEAEAELGYSHRRRRHDQGSAEGRSQAYRGLLIESARWRWTAAHDVIGNRSKSGFRLDKTLARSIWGRSRCQMR
jgi:hypothetical protein